MPDGVGPHTLCLVVCCIHLQVKGAFLHACRFLWLQALTESQDLCPFFGQQVSQPAWSGSTQEAFFTT